MLRSLSTAALALASPVAAFKLGAESESEQASANKFHLRAHTKGTFAVKAKAELHSHSTTKAHTHANSHVTSPIRKIVILLQDMQKELSSK